MIQTVFKKVLRNIGGEFNRMRTKIIPCGSMLVLFISTTTCERFQVNIIPSRVAQMTKFSAEWKTHPDAIIQQPPLFPFSQYS